MTTNAPAPPTIAQVMAMTMPEQIAYFSTPPSAGALPPQLNQLARSILQGTAIPQTIHLGSFGPYNPGQRAQINLDRVGLFQSVIVKISATVVIATAAATAGEFGPYPLVSSIEYKDFQQVSRVSMTGPELWMKNSQRQGRFLGLAPANPYAPAPNVGNIDTNIVAQPTAIGTGTMEFFLVVPMAYLPYVMTEGSVLAQTTQGQHKLFLNFVNNAVGTDPYVSPYTATAGDVTISNIYVDVFENIFALQNGALPWNDLNTIYALEGNQTDNTNLSAGQVKNIDWPNRRSVMVQSFFVNQAATGGVLNGTDVDSIQFQLNSTLLVLDYTPAHLRALMRDNINGDLGPGCYTISRRANPVNTVQYGQARTLLKMTTAAAGTYLAYNYEVKYAAGIALPGVPQG